MKHPSDHPGHRGHPGRGCLCGSGSAEHAPPESAAPAAAAPAAPRHPPRARPSGPNAELTAALAGEYTGTTVDVFAQWIDAEGQAFDDSLKAFRDATGINVVYSGITNYETVLNVRVDGGLAPDVAQLAQPGRCESFQADGKLIELGNEILDTDTITADYSPCFVDAGSVDGKLYGLFYKQDLKSIVWYPVKAFETAGYAVPTTWDELVALSDKIVADGSNPWCTTIEHGDASGWVATDWLEDVLLRTAGADDVRPVGHPRDPVQRPGRHQRGQHRRADVVHRGLRLRRQHPDQRDVGRRLADPDVRRGRSEVLDAQAGGLDPRLLAEGCRRQRAVQAGRRQLVLLLPARSTQQYGNPVLGGGDMFVMFNDRPEVRAFVQWLSTVDAVEGSSRHRRLPRGQQRGPRRVVHELPDVRPGRDRPQRDRLPRRRLGLDAQGGRARARSGRGWSSGSRRMARAPQAIFDEIEASWP